MMDTSQAAALLEVVATKADQRLGFGAKSASRSSALGGALQVREYRKLMWHARQSKVWVR